MGFIQVLVPPIIVAFSNHYRGTKVQRSSAVYLIDRKDLAPSPSPLLRLVLANKNGHLVHLQQASIRAPLSSSTARSCPFPVLSYSADANIICCHAIGNRSGDISAMQTNHRSHSSVVIASRTLRKEMANSPGAMEPFRVILGTAIHLLAHIQYNFL